MKTRLTKTQAQEKISEFFTKSSFQPKALKKIKRLAMKFHIKLSPYKMKFCKACLSPLKGRTRISSTTKTIECSSCFHKNKYKIK